MRKPDRPTSGVILRCAIYMRKSSEDGLEQEFNSLDAQREACEAFVKSQRHVDAPGAEGENRLGGGARAGDDGGFSQRYEVHPIQIYAWAPRKIFAPSAAGIRFTQRSIS